MFILALAAATLVPNSAVPHDPLAGNVAVSPTPPGPSSDPVAPQVALPPPTSDPSRSQAPPVPVAPVISTELSPPSEAKPALDHGAEHNDIIVRAEPRTVPGDPLQQLNLTSFKAVQAVDQAVVRPAAMAYSHIVPNPIRSGVRNFLDHLTEPVIFVNYLLQLKPGKAAETFGRFAINSTVGVAGIFDIAKRRPFKLPHRPNGFAYTMGYYGVKPGPFLFLPLVGPTTVRDLIGVILDRAFVPLAFGRPFNRPAYAIPANVFGQLDQRAQLDVTLNKLHNQSGRPYGATREDYLQRRQAEIDVLRGKRNDVDETVPDVAKVQPK